MDQRTKKGLKLAGAAIFAALLVAFTVNAVVDFWLPQADLKDAVAPKEAVVPAIEPTSLQIPFAKQPSPPSPLPQTPATASQPQWNQPLFEPKFDGSASTRSSGGGAQTFSAPDFSKALNQFAPPLQVLPPSISVTGRDPASVAIRPIFGSKAGGTEGDALSAAGNITGTAGNTVGGVTSGAGALLNKR
jgi:hypothetical protein